VCGIFGYCALRAGAKLPSGERLDQISLALRHRGPDEGGIFVEGPVALGSRRLSIVDLVTGRQPLQNEAGSIHLVCNGEIYNSPDLRRDLEKTHTFRTRSDTEVILHLYEDLGPGLLDRLEGMFAFALYDSRNRRLMLARDRAGEKPLFYGISGGVLYFASELTALRRFNGLGQAIDPGALRLYLTFGYFPAPRTPYSDIRKLTPGTYALIEPGTDDPKIATYWSMREHAIAGARQSPMNAREEAQATAGLRERIDASVRRQLMGDVPAGVALSGGLDSGWIAGVASRHGSEKLHTFTVSFAEPSYDEGGAAAWLARKLSTNHHVARADAGSLARAIEFLTMHMDEPLGDPAVLPTFLLAEEARRHVKVILGGEGADELFGGYPTYIGHRLAARYGRLPGWLRDGVIRPWIESLPMTEKKVALPFLLKRFVEDATRPTLERHVAWFGVLPPEEADRIAGPLLAPDGPRSQAGQSSASGGTFEAVEILNELLGEAEDWGKADLERLLYIDFRTYLGEGLLTKIDRVSMSCSLESRSPYLGRDILEFAARLPISCKIGRTSTKKILRKAAAAEVPAEVLRRRKRGLSVPLAGLFRRELRRFVQDELDPRRLDREGLLSGRHVDSIVRAHLEGRSDRARALWACLSLVRWYRHHVLDVPLSSCALSSCIVPLRTSSEKSKPVSI
jgi:asparagine synthase (glutamine-hydrolysing)